MIKKGSYVEISKIVLTSEDRAKNIPEDTKSTPLKMWVRGHVLMDCNIGDEVEIETIIGRKIRGVLVEENPNYNHSFGKHISEIDYIGKQAKEILFEN
ncbi:2-amino-4-oxopentanoate thiolase subunit OrtA [Clostridium senegalense]|uniref:2-amino-4-oxopentanoate thiolase subunit OrtA n=1 Tax=Clostridium senegalense TaxID=1465809 RepID=UPI001C105933|nr:2-amino-4-oxopentanoate thiolase subunit OrtA [Clostridium senegalense]MBU5225671.1 2-amino-4-ketopentanoate thiolase [Clostridium senegalense]